MTIYSFYCDDCESISEIMHIAPPKATPCHNCGERAGPLYDTSPTTSEGSTDFRQESTYFQTLKPEKPSWWSLNYIFGYICVFASLIILLFGICGRSE